MADLAPCPFCGKHLERNTAFSTRRQNHFSHPPLEGEEEPCMLEHVNVVEYLDDRHAAGQGNSDRWNSRAPSPQTTEPVAWRWRSTLFTEWNLSDKPPVDQATMERETELNMVGLEWEALYSSPPPTPTATASTEVDVKTDRDLRETDHKKEREDDVAPHAAAIPPLGAEAKSPAPQDQEAGSTLSVWSGWDQSNLPWSQAKHQDAACRAVFGPSWAMEDATALIGFIERTWPREPAGPQP